MQALGMNDVDITEDIDTDQREERLMSMSFSSWVVIPLLRFERLLSHEHEDYHWLSSSSFAPPRFLKWQGVQQLR